MKVNLTLGLPIVRTSPDHGTAYSIAGKNKASPSSMIAAIRTAITLADKHNPWRKTQLNRPVVSGWVIVQIKTFNRCKYFAIDRGYGCFTPEDAVLEIVRV